MDVLRLVAVVVLTLGLASRACADTPAVETATQTSPSASASSTEPASTAAAAPVPAPSPAAILALPPPEFDGVKPGISKLDEVLEHWGAPREIRGADGRGIYVFEKAPFQRVEVILEKELVGSIVLHLQKPLPADEAAAKFKLQALHPVTIYDEGHKALGVAYPERGVLLAFASPDKPLCDQAVFGRLQPQAFVLRAECNLKQSCTASLFDLEAALALDPNYGAAHWLRAQVLADMGSLPTALAAADEALRLEPNNPEYRLLRSRILAENSDFEQAMAETRRAMADCETQPEIKARALCQLGDQLTAGPGRDYRGAIEQHQQAIKLAQEALKDSRAVVRRAAKTVMIDAHLAVAQDIAWGAWTKKATVVPKWLDQATQLAKEAIATDGADQELWFDVARRIVAVHVGLEGGLDPAKWIDESLRTGRELIAATKDPVKRRQLEWALGVMLYDALQIYLTVNQYDAALKYGTLALSLLEGAAELHKDRSGHSYMMGRLYFRLGSIEIAANRDHTAAAKWFKKAAPLLEQKIPNSALADVGSQGESLATIGETLWHANDRDEALRLTELGLDLLEHAVEKGILKPPSLHLPYKNLAKMHQELGNRRLAKAYERLASQPASAEPSTTVR